jgi:hypothetical protein
MRAHVLAEPELEFGGASRHIDPRFGISTFGPSDLGASEQPKAMRLGLVGPDQDLEALKVWLEHCRDEIPAKDERYPHLFPAFPGCDVDRGLCSTVVFSDRATNTVSPTALREIERVSGRAALDRAVEAYCDEARALAESNRVDVIVLARPTGLKDVAMPPRGSRKVDDDADDDVAADVAMRFSNFHDLVKARLLSMGTPVQIVRRSTFDESVAPPTGSSRQDEATRAWNLHVALYYKAGGVPWRMQRDSRDLTTCFVGVSFYRAGGDGNLETAVAQVFNERGDGVVVRGESAVPRGEDRQPHLSGEGASGLLMSALDEYRREHRTEPARVVVHKASAFTDSEADGFRSAAEDRRLDALDLMWVTSSEGVRAYRQGQAPPLRGTMIEIADDEAVLYTKGSIDFYSTYPGMHVPTPIGIRALSPTKSIKALGEEVMALSKMNWNQTRLDGRLPVTLRTAEQVKRVLRFVDPASPAAARYAQYM